MRSVSAHPQRAEPYGTRHSRDEEGRSAPEWGRLAADVIIVSTGTCRHTPRGYVRTTYSADEVDAIAVHCLPLNRSFYLPIEEVAGSSVVHLRLAPAARSRRH